MTEFEIVQKIVVELVPEIANVTEIVTERATEIEIVQEIVGEVVPEIAIFATEIEILPEVSAISIREIKVTHVTSSTTFTKPGKKKKKKKKAKTPATTYAEEEMNVKPEEWWKVTYTVYFSRAINGYPRLKIQSSKDIWNSECPATLTKEMAHADIMNIASESNLNCYADVGNYYMQNDTPWEYLWAKAENDIKKFEIDTGRNVRHALKGHNKRAETTRSRNWERGIVFNSADAKWQAKESVMKQLEISSEKQLSKAESILSGIITNLAKKQGLKTASLRSEGMKKKIRLGESLVRSVSSFVGSLGRNVTPATTSLLTGLTAVLAPQPHHFTHDLVSACKLSNVLGL